MKAPTPILIESLEARIAPAGFTTAGISMLAGDVSDAHPAASHGSVIFDLVPGKTYSFRDTDGDLVKVTTSVGVLDPAAFTFSPSGMGQQLDLLDLTGGALAGANLKIKAIPQMVHGVLVGDGHV